MIRQTRARSCALLCERRLQTLSPPASKIFRSQRAPFVRERKVRNSLIHFGTRARLLRQIIRFRAFPAEANIPNARRKLPRCPRYTSSDAFVQLSTSILQQLFPKCSRRIRACTVLDWLRWVLESWRKYRQNVGSILLEKCRVERFQSPLQSKFLLDKSSYCYYRANVLIQMILLNTIREEIYILFRDKLRYTNTETMFIRWIRGRINVEKFLAELCLASTFASQRRYLSRVCGPLSWQTSQPTLFSRSKILRPT